MMKLGKSIVTTCLGILLISCQGSDTQLAEGGITGSGISLGPITGFGSIWVGGVRFDVSNAEFIRNGRTSPYGQDAFHVGEIVDITGEINQDGVTGVATKVEFDRRLSGLVSARSTDGITVRVLDQLVETDALTLFTGFNALSELSVGNVVEISGSRTPEGTWIASTINRTQTAFVLGESELEVEGRITAVHDGAQTFKVGNLTINYSQSILNGVTDLSQAAGQYIEIQSQKNLVNGQLLASQIEPEDEYPQFEVGSFTNMDGRITDFSNNQAFDVNGQSAIITKSTVLIDGSETDLGLGAHIGIEGTINNNGVLAADKITIRQSADADSALTLEARIESLDSENTELTVLGSTVTVNSSTIILDYSQNQAGSIQFDDLFIDDLIRITGRKLENGKVLALRIDRNPPEVIIVEQSGNEDSQEGAETDDTEQATESTDPTDEDDGTDAGGQALEDGFNEDGVTTLPAEEDQSGISPDDNAGESGTNSEQVEAPQDSSNAGTSTGQENDGREIIKLQGSVSNVDSQNLTFMINDTHILTDTDTLYKTSLPTSESLSQIDFFNSLLRSEKIVKIEGYSLGNGWLQAIEIELLPN